MHFQPKATPTSRKNVRKSPRGASDVEYPNVSARNRDVNITWKKAYFRTPHRHGLEFSLQKIRLFNLRRNRGKSLEVHCLNDRWGDVPGDVTKQKGVWKFQNDFKE
ncbi:hypothetical protein DPMN_108243 [Dreissena polymorpha]|uniref:Uncharacterized protein n=1 Tax=Dreissena polymorpha TaxID=45954 RepID=A0A9D4K8H9_DREPO|nr:hypothetical protein DPMN_108243 [Dreissena polymorpha]